LPIGNASTLAFQVASNPGKFCLVSSISLFPLGDCARFDISQLGNQRQSISLLLQRGERGRRRRDQAISHIDSVSDETIELGLILDLPGAPQKLALTLPGPGDQLAQRNRHVAASKKSTDVLDSLSDQHRFLSPTLPPLELAICEKAGEQPGETENDTNGEESDEWKK
jgi:hypothetical protein